MLASSSLEEMNAETVEVRLRSSEGTFAITAPFLNSVAMGIIVAHNLRLGVLVGALRLGGELDDHDVVRLTFNTEEERRFGTLRATNEKDITVESVANDT
mmetsp:Transcript_8560/g.14212  ORF Transcript_8560/g.14212 Transcript_8560/m.14212 type:complete len:100 (+) Transcript_8560:2936-3235(+)